MSNLRPVTKQYEESEKETGRGGNEGQLWGFGFYEFVASFLWL